MELHMVASWQDNLFHLHGSPTCKTLHTLPCTGCGRNNELIINNNNILLKVIVTNFSMSQFTMVLNFFFYIVSLFVYNVF